MYKCTSISDLCTMRAANLYQPMEESVDQAEFEVQLQVWKDLAISKQVLIGAATDALGLDPECESAELK